MSVEDHVTSVYQLPKFRLTAAPRHEYCSRHQTECKASGSQPLDSVQFWQRQQPQQQTQQQVKNALHMLQTQECSRKFSSAVLSIQTSPPGHTAAPSSTAVAVKNGGHHIQPAWSHTVEDTKKKSFPASPPSPYGNTSCCVDGPPLDPVVRHENAGHQRRGKLTLQTNSIKIQSAGRNVAEQTHKDSDRPSTVASRARSAWKAKVDDSQKYRKQLGSTFNVVSGSCNNSASKQQYYIKTSRNNINNSNCLRQCDLAALKLIDHSAKQQKVEDARSNASPLCSDGSKRCISVALLMQNGSLKASRFTVTAEKRDVHNRVAPAFVIAASDNADNGRISESVTPEMQTLEPDNAAVTLKQHENDVDSYTQEPLSHSCEEPVNIKIEKRLISNTPMTICTLPVPRPALVCKPLLPETTASSRAGFSHPTSVARSYHETTRSQRHEDLPVTETGHITERRRSAAVSRLPYVGADLWELTTQRLQSAIIDKVSNGPQLELRNSAAESLNGCEVSSSTSPSTSSDLVHQNDTEQSQNDVGMYVKKCLSAKAIHPKTEQSVTSSRSTSRLQQNLAEDDEDEAVADCDIEL